MNFYKKHKNKIIISSLVIIGVLLIVFSSAKLSDKKTDEFSVITYTKELEKKLEGFLKSVEGINKVEVIITLECSNEHVYAKNESSYDYIISSNGNLVEITEVFPVVRGVAIACTNGSNDIVQKEITELVSSYLGISSNRIKIVSID